MYSRGSPTRSRLRSLVCACCCAVLLLFGNDTARANGPVISKEYKLKAAFLYNFTRFVDWPASQFASDSSPIVIAVLGTNPFGEELHEVVRDRTVNGRPIEIFHLASPAGAPQVHAVFIADREDASLEKDIRDLHTAGVLTVGESDRFFRLGGIVTFIRAGDKVRFQINMTSAGVARLKVSSQLQKLAVSVRKS